MKHLITVIILTVSLSCSGQRFQFDRTKISSQTKEIASRIEKANILMSDAVGYAGARQKQFDNFSELRKIASSKELQELTNHPNGVVRCYSFWALAGDSSVNLLPIVARHISDEEKVTTMFGCIVSNSKVGDFFIDIVTPNYIDREAKKLTPAEFDYLDSLLIYTKNRLQAKEDAIGRGKPSETLYERVKELVLKESNQSALVTLARFKREQDIPLILSNRWKDTRYNQLFYTYRAISEFPHSDFLPLLKRSLYDAIAEEPLSNEWRELYIAIAGFKTDTALQLLKVPFAGTKHESAKRYHVQFIFEAVQHFYTPIYDELLWEIWEKEKKINAKVFNLLYSANPEKAFQLTKKTIEKADDFYYLNSMSDNEEGETTVNLLNSMLDTIIARDRPYAIEQININIRGINVHQFPTFATKALEIRDTSFVESFFYRLRTEDNPHIYLKAIEVLIAWNDKGINDRILEVGRTNPALKEDWGGKEFARLLEQNGIK